MDKQATILTFQRKEVQKDIIAQKKTANDGQPVNFNNEENAGREAEAEDVSMVSRPTIIFCGSRVCPHTYKKWGYHEGKYIEKYTEK